MCREIEEEELRLLRGVLERQGEHGKERAFGLFGWGGRSKAPKLCVNKEERT